MVKRRVGLRMKMYFVKYLRVVAYATVRLKIRKKPYLNILVYTKENGHEHLG